MQQHVTVYSTMKKHLMMVDQGRPRASRSTGNQRAQPAAAPAIVEPTRRTGSSGRTSKPHVPLSSCGPRISSPQSSALHSSSLVGSHPFSAPPSQALGAWWEAGPRPLWCSGPPGLRTSGRAKRLAWRLLAGQRPPGDWEPMRGSPSWSKSARPSTGVTGPMRPAGGGRELGSWKLMGELLGASGEPCGPSVPGVYGEPLRFLSLKPLLGGGLAPACG
mmetsp:Transcript_48676/g.125508  ORF Transcript_48676/g.125508 Transcript_48676/m.125508 type:complete len:218 (+) Transcript_48676:485-1138(+)